MLADDEIIRFAKAHSRYVARALEADPEQLPQLLQHLHRPFSREEMQSILDSQQVADEAGLQRALRRLRRAVMLRLISRDLGGLADFFEVALTASMLAEVAVGFAQSHLDRWMQGQYGAPLGAESGLAQQLLVVGMGKLGGRELNVSSDIDLIFVYPEEGETAGPKSIDCHEYFTRLGRKLIASLDELSADGYVFRVDMRLRPYGQSGPLVSSFAALEAYMLTQGREWERYAWIKGRALTGSETDALDEIVRPFVFRKYLDFGAYGSMRELHGQIREQVRRREMQDDIKLGPGGIREIEFIAQVFQLIRGGSDPLLRQKGTLPVLEYLARKRLISREVSTQLREAYLFLRNLEHRLQYLDDQQTQQLPGNPEDRQLIAQTMGFGDFAAFFAALDEHRKKVEFHFEQVFGAPQPRDSDWSRLFADRFDSEWASRKLESLGFKESGKMLERLAALHGGARYRGLPAASQKRVDELLPALIEASASRDNPDQTLERLLNLIESIGRRAPYLALLQQYPTALDQLARLAAASQWAAEYLCRHPILLDELLDSRELYSAPDWDAIESGLVQRLTDASGDVERQMDAARHVHHAAVFGLLAKDLAGLLPLETLSDHLSMLADLMLRHVLDLCWQSLRNRHRTDSPQFAIIGYGKLGGKELGYASDLDLIFLYDDPHPDAPEVYARLAQRINAWITSYTPAGNLYETDLRLRPNGAAGLLVSSIEAFGQYQKHEAWVWEHQALTRARFVAGSKSVGEAFDAIRESVLRQPRRHGELKSEILSMRAKMLEGHPNPTALFDLKHDRGGIVDVEFMVQFLVLLYSHSHPELVENVGNLALLSRAGNLGLIQPDQAEAARAAYRKFRSLQHSLRLKGEAYARIGPDQVAGEIESVLGLWRLMFESA